MYLAEAVCYVLIHGNGSYSDILQYTQVLELKITLISELL